MAIGLSLDMSKPEDRKIISKLRRGAPVQVKPIHLQSPPTIEMEVDDAKMKKIMSAMRRGVGSRIQLTGDEASTIRGEGLIFTPSGRVMKGGKVKSLKQLNKETSRAFKKAGKEIKDAFEKDLPDVADKAVKGYKKKVRPFASPVFKELLVNQVPKLAGKAVEEGLKSQGVPPMGAKVASKLVEAGLKKPMDMGYKKSGLGLKKNLAMVGDVVKKTAKKATRTTKKKTMEAVENMGMGLKSDIAMVGDVLEKTAKKASRATKKTTKKAMDHMGSGGAITSPQLRLAMSPLVNDEVNGGRGMTVARYRSPVVDEISKNRIVAGRGLFGGMIYNDRMIDPLDNSYSPNPMVDAFHPELNFGNGLFAGRSGNGLYAGRSGMVFY